MAGRTSAVCPEIGSSAATERLRMQVRTVGPHFRTALIKGERGGRKEEVARALHAASPVAGGSFVVCDAGAMESLRKGDGSGSGRGVCEELLQAGRGGTMFFPELGLFSIAAQVDLLQLLDRIGEEQGARVRVIGSVSGDVQAMVAGGTLRSELRDRLGMVELTVTPLRERMEDVAAVAARVLEGIATRSGGALVRISTEALRELQRRGWPGNERELESVLRMAALACDGGSGRALIEERHLPAATAHTEQAGGAATGMTVSSAKLQDVVDAHVQDVLRKCEGNKLRAAEVLGISRSTLYRMLDAAAALAGRS